jgi:hypothetical protein
MDGMPQLSISPVLRSAAELKIDELIRVKETLKRRYQSSTAQATNVDTVTRVKTLLEDVKELDPEADDDDDVDIMASFVDQAENERTVSELQVLKLEKQLRRKISKQLDRLEVSALHAELLQEALDVGSTIASATAKLEHLDLGDDFEVVEEQDLNDLFEKFENDTFTEQNIDVEALVDYLSGLCPGDELDTLRDDLQSFEKELLSDGLDIDRDFLVWCIMDLLKDAFISEDRRRTLESYIQSPIALRELVSLLNMKSVRHWDYKNADQGLTVTPLQNAEGQLSIVIEEEIVDSLFLHAMGMRWAMQLKTCLKEFARCSASFSIPAVSVDELYKRNYFLGGDVPKKEEVVPAPTTCTTCHPTYHFEPMGMPPPPPPLGLCPPPPPPDHFLSFPSKKSKIKRRNTVWIMPPPPPPPAGCGSLAAARHDKYIGDFFMSRLPVLEGCTPDVTQPEEVQADLIKTLAVDRVMRLGLDGEFHAGSAHLKSPASALSHQTVLTVLKFLGVQKTSLDTFERFLSAKLNIGPEVRGAPDRVLPRARGMPEGHALEMFFTEAVMFFLELAVHQKTGSMMYRLEGHCYFVGTGEQFQGFEEQVKNFAKVTGVQAELDVNQSIGFFDLRTGIEHAKVLAYANRVKKQLQACKSVFDWVRVWNSTAGTYAAHLFGPLAEVLGKAHHENVKKAYDVIFDVVFDGSSLIVHVEKLLTLHLKPGLVDHIFSIEALIYLPQEYGGLGVKNPFIAISLAKTYNEDPHDEIIGYCKEEILYYQRAAESYAPLDGEGYARKLEFVFNKDKARIDAALGPERDLTVFMTLEELITNRERLMYPILPSGPGASLSYPCVRPTLDSVYNNLLREPTHSFARSEKIRDEVSRLEDKDDMKSWRSLSDEDKWVLQLYGDECFEKFGGLEIWCSECVPQEVLKLVRGAAWDEADDSSSCSSLSEP